MANLSIEDPNHKCTVITVGNHKGGCCKTTLCFALANYLFNENCRVLVIDTDPQGDLGKSFSVDGNAVEYRDNSLASVYREFECETVTDKMFNAPLLVKGDLDNISGAAILLLPGNSRLIASVKYAIEVSNGDGACRELFTKLINAYKAYFDYIIFDTTPVIEESLSGSHAISVSDCVVVPVDAIAAAEGIDKTIRVINKYRKNNVKVLFAFTKYQSDDVDLTNTFERQCDIRGLSKCEASINVKSSTHIKGYNERKNTVYRFMRKVFPYNTCITGIPEEQKINNNSYTTLDKKYKTLYDVLCLEIRRKIRDGVEDTLCVEDEWNMKSIELNAYSSIVRGYRVKNTPKKLNKVAFLDVKLNMLGTY